MRPLWPEAGRLQVFRFESSLIGSRRVQVMGMPLHGKWVIC